MWFLTLSCIHRVVSFFGLYQQCVSLLWAYQQCVSLLWAVSTVCFLTLGCFNNALPYFGPHQHCGSLVLVVSTVWFVTLCCINRVMCRNLDGISAVCSHTIGCINTVWSLTRFYQYNFTRNFTPGLYRATPKLLGCISTLRP